MRLFSPLVLLIHATVSLKNLKIIRHAFANKLDFSTGNVWPSHPAQIGISAAYQKFPVYFGSCSMVMLRFVPYILYHRWLTPNKLAAVILAKRRRYQRKRQRSGFVRPRRHLWLHSFQIAVVKMTGNHFTPFHRFKKIGFCPCGLIDTFF